METYFITEYYIDKYPLLKNILSQTSLEHLMSEDQISTSVKFDAICQQCNRSTELNLRSILKQYRRNASKKANFIYRCHRCSKEGNTKINVDTILSVIDLPATIEKFGGLPKNVKLGKVVAICEDCKKPSDVILSNVMHQARRHKNNGRTCLYKCFSCGIKRPDAVEKSIASRMMQLSTGFRSGLEVAMANRLQVLGIPYETQWRMDMYAWDFYLPDHDTVIDVNGEYWHSLKENITKDKAKFTYAKRYRPDLKVLIVEEKNFLNPLRVDTEVLNALNMSANIVQVDFNFNSVIVKPIITGSGSKKSPYVNFLNSFHYSMCGRLGKIVYGAFLEDDLIGVCKFSSVIRQEVASSLKLKCYQVMELDRFCIHPKFQKKNFASWFLSRCSKAIFAENPKLVGLVTFADETFGHSGTIYKASNWKFVGKTRPSYHYMDASGIPINKKRVYDIASKLLMKEREYAEKHELLKFAEKPKSKFILFAKDHEV